DGPPWQSEGVGDTPQRDGGNRGSRAPIEYWGEIADALFLVLVGGIVASVWRLRSHIVSTDALLPACLTVLALCLRFAAHPGPADIRPVLVSVGPQRAAWVALVDLLYAVFPAGDETIWNVNRVVGALSVPLLYAAVRRRFADPVVAIAAAATLAVAPLLVRYAASDTPYI